MQTELQFAFQAALVIICAKFLGRFFERKRGQPSLIGKSRPVSRSDLSHSAAW